MAFEFAVEVDDEARNRASWLIKNSAMSVFLRGTATLATLYVDRDKSDTADNPTTTDALGRYSFFIDPGRYTLDIDGATSDLTVFVDPEEVAQDTDVTVHAAAANPHPGYLTPAEGSAAYQPLDANLTAIAALDSGTAGALATDGGGWIRKTYAQFKTALGLAKADVGLGNVDNTADADKPVSTAQAVADALKLAKASNLNDLADVATARATLGVEPIMQSGTIGARPAAATFGVGFYNATDESGGTLYHSDGAAWTKMSRGRLLAVTSYNPATSTTTSTTSSTPSDVDATNLAVTFIAPASGKVRVKLTAAQSAQTTSRGMWTLREGSAEVAGVAQAMSIATTVLRATASMLVTGLTPGQSYTWKWAFWSGDNTLSVSVRYGGTGANATYGPAVMEVSEVSA
jgi:hypothetical protein